MRKKRNRLLKGIGCVLAAVLVCLLAIPAKTHAATGEYTATVQGLYRHPQTGVIEDSGGESSYALGQSMVGSVVDPTGLMCQTESGTWSIQLRFHLMDNITKVSFQVQQAGEEKWEDVEAAVTGSGEETKDFYVPLPAKESVIRAECYVTAMGRSVIFYVTYDQLKEGNETDFKAYVPPQEKASGSESREMAVDESFWLLLFLVTFCGSFCSGILLLILFTAFQSISRSRKSVRKERLKLFDRPDPEMENDDFEFDFMEELREEE